MAQNFLYAPQNNLGHLHKTSSSGVIYQKTKQKLNKSLKNPNIIKNRRS